MTVLGMLIGADQPGQIQHLDPAAADFELPFPAQVFEAGVSRINEIPQYQAV
jgi:hypothetical protein